VLLPELNAKPGGGFEGEMCMKEVQRVVYHIGFQMGTLKVENKVDGDCVRSCMMYESETRPMKEGTDMRMVKWMDVWYLFVRGENLTRSHPLFGAKSSLSKIDG